MSKKPFDASVKDLVELAPEDWLVLAGYPKAPVRLIDADLTAVSRGADKVMRVEGVERYLFHLEFQSGHDAAKLPPKLNVRNGLLEDRHDLPVRTVVVVLRPAADSPALSGVYRRAFPGEEPYRVFRYDVVRVWKLDPEALLAGGWGTLPLAPVAAKSDADVPGIMTRVLNRVESPGGHAMAAGLMAITLALLELRYSKEEVQMLLKDVLNVEGSQIYQSILQEGGTKRSHHMLVLQGTRRFGPPGEKTRSKIEAITDLDRLDALSLRLLEVNSWQELLAEDKAPKPSPRRPKKRKGS